MTRPDLHTIKKRGAVLTPRYFFLWYGFIRKKYPILSQHPHRMWQQPWWSDQFCIPVCYEAYPAWRRQCCWSNAPLRHHSGVCRNSGWIVYWYNLVIARRLRRSNLMNLEASLYWIDYRRCLILSPCSDGRPSSFSLCGCIDRTHGLQTCHDMLYTFTGFRRHPS